MRESTIPAPIWRSGSGTVTNWLGQEDGSFSGNLANAFATTSLAWDVLGVGDFNGDGRDDVL